MHWRSPESGDAWNRSRRLKKTICSRYEGWWERKADTANRSKRRRRVKEGGAEFPAAEIQQVMSPLLVTCCSEPPAAGQQLSLEPSVALESASMQQPMTPNTYDRNRRSEFMHRLKKRQSSGQPMVHTFSRFEWSALAHPHSQKAQITYVLILFWHRSGRGRRNPVSLA